MKSDDFCEISTWKTQSFTTKKLLYAKRSLTLFHLDFSARLNEVYTRNCWSNSSLCKENAKCTWGILLALFSVRRSREEQSEQRRGERKTHENKTNFPPAPRHAHMAVCRQSFGTRALSLWHSGNTKQMVFRYVAELYDDENANSFRLLNVFLVFFFFA